MRGRIIVVCAQICSVPHYSAPSLGILISVPLSPFKVFSPFGASPKTCAPFDETGSESENIATTRAKETTEQVSHERILHQNGITNPSPL